MVSQAIPCVCKVFEDMTPVTRVAVESSQKLLLCSKHDTGVFESYLLCKVYVPQKDANPQDEIGYWYQIEKGE